MDKFCIVFVVTFPAKAIVQIEYTDWPNFVTRISYSFPVEQYFNQSL